MSRARKVGRKIASVNGMTVPVLVLLRSLNELTLALALALAMVPTPTNANVSNIVPQLRSARQLVLVKTRSWRDLNATVQLFERPSSGSWQVSSGAMPAVIGWHGLGWGIGLHGTGVSGQPQKTEGDGRSPAGVFRFSEIFGKAAPSAVRFLRLAYRQVTPTTEAVDDPGSRFYNRIVDRATVDRPDWSHSEGMARVGGQYHWGLMVEHNWQQIPARGSCIFLHVWAGPHGGTTGCTALGEGDLEHLLRWLDPRAQPLLVQLPEPELAKRRKAWGLP